MKKSEFKIVLSYSINEFSLNNAFITYYIKAIDQRTAINLALSKLLKNENPYFYHCNTCTKVEKRSYVPSMFEPCCELAHNG